MTFAELVKKVAGDNDLTLAKAEKVINDALNTAADAAEKGEAPYFPGIGRFVAAPVRSTGRKPDGTVWTKPGRTKLTLRASVHRGGMGEKKKQIVKSLTSETQAA